MNFNSEFDPFYKIEKFTGEEIQAILEKAHDSQFIDNKMYNELTENVSYLNEELEGLITSIVNLGNSLTALDAETDQAIGRIDNRIDGLTEDVRTEMGRDINALIASNEVAFLDLQMKLEDYYIKQLNDALTRFRVRYVDVCAKKSQLDTKASLVHEHHSNDIIVDVNSSGEATKLLSEKLVELDHHNHDDDYAKIGHRHYGTIINQDGEEEEREINWDILAKIATDDVLAMWTEVVNRVLYDIAPTADGGVGSEALELLEEKLNNRIEQMEQELINSQHQHANKSVLDGISQDRVTEWDNSNKIQTTRTVSTAIGGISAGTELDGKTVQEILLMMLSPDKKPSISVSIDNTPNKNIFEVGETVTLNTLSAIVGVGTYEIESVKFYENGSLIATFSAPPYTFELNRTITSNLSSSYYQAEVIDTNQNVVRGNSESFSFYYPMYYGSVARAIEIGTVNKNIVSGLSGKIVNAKSNQTLSFTTSDERMMFAYPASYGSLTSILDPNGFEQISSFDSTTITLDNQQSYRVYLNNANTNTNFKLTFKF